MNTNQDTTLTNQDEFEKWWRRTDAHLVLCSRNSAEAGYLAATKASEQRIHDLEYLINLDTELHENSAKTILELQANVHKLQEALGDMVESYQYEASCENPPLINAKNLLSTTPAQSLAEHNKELIDRCAKEIDKMVNVYTKNCDKYKIIGSELDVERNVNKARAAMSCAAVIRSLKVTP